MTTPPTTPAPTPERINAARELLDKAGLFYGCDDPEDDPENAQTLNLNDAFWGCADSEYIADEELPRVAQLFNKYGMAGVYYWVAVEKRGGEVPEFVDISRLIDFVKHEEAIIKEEPDSSRRAYLKREYTLGTDGPTAAERERDEARAALARAERRIEDITCDYRMAKTDLDEAREENKRLREACFRLVEIADEYSADQTDALGTHSGYVQPITPEQGVELNEAIEQAREALKGGGE